MAPPQPQHPPAPLTARHAHSPVSPRPRAPPPPPHPLVAPLAPLNTRPIQHHQPLLAPSQSATTTTSASTTPATPTLVTLTVPRPENVRSTNEYVEAPFDRGVPSPHQLALATGGGVRAQPQRPSRPTLLPTTHAPTHHHQPAAPLANLSTIATTTPPPVTTTTTTAVTKQPTAAQSRKTSTPASFSKDPQLQQQCSSRPSIMCPACGRCRCESCQTPRPLPQRWICGDTCLLSADSALDYVTCLCCAKGLFYHCADSAAADEPCGCGPERRAARWTCLAALSCALPCLWLYWPLRGCKSLVEECYARHSRTGCRCQQSSSSSNSDTPVTTVPTPEKRLLDPTIVDF